MGNIVIGDEGCDFKIVVEILTSEPYQAVTRNQMQALAYELGESSAYIKFMAKKLEDPDYPLSVEFSELLPKWRSRKNMDCTVDELCRILEKVGLNASADLLKSSFTNKKKEVSTAVNPTTGIAKAQKSILSFDKNISIKTNVFIPLIPSLKSIMTEKSTNTTIIMHLNSLGVYEEAETEGILISRHRTETERMIDFFQVIKNCEDKDILKCLEKLCDLPDLPKKSERIKKAIKHLFPDSL